MIHLGERSSSSHTAYACVNTPCKLLVCCVKVKLCERADRSEGFLN